MMSAHLQTVSTKACKGCGQNLPATSEWFSPHRLGKLGLHPRCRPCKNLQDTAQRRSPEQKARQQAWRDSNKDATQQYNQAYRAAGYSSTAAVREWRAANIEHARRNERERMVRYRQTKPWFALKGRISARMTSMLAGCGGKARVSTEALLGYSLAELVSHIERQFTDGMTWEAFHRGEIHLDHIVPVAAFKPASVTCPEFRACWALTNLRPLWAADNHKKGSKREFLL